MSEEHSLYKLIRADFMVSKTHIQQISEEVVNAGKSGVRKTKSQIVRAALDLYFKEPYKNFCLSSPTSPKDTEALKLRP